MRCRSISGKIMRMRITIQVTLDTSRYQERNVIHKGASSYHGESGHRAGHYQTHPTACLIFLWQQHGSWRDLGPVVRVGTSSVTRDWPRRDANTGYILPP